jgi:hypothetical protein
LTVLNDIPPDIEETIMTIDTFRAAWLLALAFPVLLSACGGAHGATDQSKLCVFSNDAQAKKCHSGELAYFSPNSWGNAQLPLNVIATYCNTNEPVQFNEAGVVCTFTDKRLWLLTPSK